MTTNPAAAGGEHARRAGGLGCPPARCATGGRGPRSGRRASSLARRAAVPPSSAAAPSAHPSARRTRRTDEDRPSRCARACGVRPCASACARLTTRCCLASSAPRSDTPPILAAHASDRLAAPRSVDHPHDRGNSATAIAVLMFPGSPGEDHNRAGR